jgi:hypothetical protein
MMAATTRQKQMHHRIVPQALLLGLQERSFFGGLQVCAAKVADDLSKQTASACPLRPVGSLGELASNPHFPASNLNLETSLLEPRSCLHIGSTKMASNAVVFLAGVGTTFAVLTAGFSGGLVFTKAAFEDRPAPTRADPGPAPRVRVILPAYAEPAPSLTNQNQTDAPAAAKSEVQPARDAPIPVAQEKTDIRKAERQARFEARRQAERKARKIAAARAKQHMEALRREEPAMMAFGGDGPHLFGN